MMFGQTLFAEIPLADMGKPPHVETGWIEVCKDPCQEAAWIKKGKNEVNTNDCEYIPTNWKPIV